MTGKLLSTYLERPIQAPTQARQKTDYEDKYHEVFAELRRIAAHEDYSHQAISNAVNNLIETEVK